MILLAVILVALAVIIPQAHKYGWRGALLALVMVLAVLAALVGVLVGLFWLAEQLHNPGTGWRGRAFRLLGHLLRFALCAAIGAILMSGLLAEQGLGTRLMDALAAVAGLLGGVVGGLAYRAWGAARFWVVFRRFCMTLLGSFFGGILGLLAPGRWGVPLGILLPLLLFALLFLAGRILPPPAAAPSE
jgi:hypothetical protein